MYTVVQYGNIPLNSGLLLAHKQILQIFHFRCRSHPALLLSTYSVYGQFKAQSVHFT